MLPKLNDQPKYDILVPSLGINKKFRPYLMKEQKVLLLAMESQNPQQAMDAMLDTIAACSIDTLSKTSLTTFDVEYLFVKIRAVSEGATTKLNIKCKKCKTENEYVVNLDDIKMDVPKIDNIIKLTDTISLEMRWPSFSRIQAGIKEDSSKTDNAFSLISLSMKAIITEEEKIQLADSPPSEVEEFIESMDTKQFEKVSSFVENIPKLKYHGEFECTSCGEKNEVNIEGMNNFF